MALHPLVNIGIRAARRAGDHIVRSIQRLESVEVATKERNDFVSDVDQQAEQLIIDVIRATYPDHGVLGEEGGERPGRGRGRDVTWIIDPLDGTTNYLHGFPQFAVSIAVRERGLLEHAVVYDPLRQELFTATRGQGAQLDGRRIRVTQRRGLEGALIGTGIPFRSDADHIDPYLAMLKDVMGETAGVRRPGAAALDLAYLAAGRLDGFWEMGLNVWDIAGGALLIREAGGMVSDLAGSDRFLDTGHVCAGSPKVHAALLKLLRPHLTAQLR